MDCNNYSYLNMGTDEDTIAEYETESGNLIYFCYEYSFFQNHYYFVADVFGEIESKDFDFSINGDGTSRRMAYEQAAKYYNSLVPDDKTIPTF